MNDLTTQSLLITVGIELAVVMALVGVFLFLSIKKGKNADRNAAHELVKNVKNNDKNRKESLLKVFGECYDMEEDELNTAVDEFLNREKAFYKTLISVYVDRDATEFSKLSTALEEMVKPYSDLALSAEVAVDNEELESLQIQNRDLEKELGESKQVMDELMSEYTATFDKEAEGKTPDAVQEQAPKSEDDASDVVEALEGTFEIQVDSVPTDDKPKVSVADETLTEESKAEEGADVAAVKTDAVEKPQAAAPEPTAEATTPAEDIVAELIPEAAEATSTDDLLEQTIDVSAVSNDVVALEEIDALETIKEIEAGLTDIETPAESSSKELPESESNDVSLDEVPVTQTETAKEIIDELTNNEVSLDDLDEEIEETTT